MTKKSNRLEREAREEEWQTFSKGQFKFVPFEPLNDRQSVLLESCLSSPLVIATGPAGTAKSYVEAAAAIRIVSDPNNPIDGIVVTRSPVSTGPSTGFKPGESYEKLAPWMEPILDNLRKAATTDKGSDGFFNYLKGTGKIRMLEMESIKGLNLDNKVVILEESQELTLEQLKNMVTRIGSNSVLFINGDLKQPNSKVRDNALERYVKGIHNHNAYVDQRLEEIGDNFEQLEDWEFHVPIIEFTKEDSVRSGVCRMNLELFEREGL